jgi:type IV pilus assembly protein PilA
LVAVGIVAILVALAVPAYKDYTVRSKIAECINEAAIAKLAISEYRQAFGAWPPNLEEAGIGSSGISQFCQGFDNYENASGAFTINVDEGSIDSAVTAIAPMMTPYISTSLNITWICTTGLTAEDEVKYLPANCRGS